MTGTHVIAALAFIIGVSGQAIILAQVHPPPTTIIDQKTLLPASMVLAALVALVSVTWKLANEFSRLREISKEVEILKNKIDSLERSLSSRRDNA